MRTGAGSHFSAFASESAGPLFLPLLSHATFYRDQRQVKAAGNGQWTNIDEFWEGTWFEERRGEGKEGLMVLYSYYVR